MKKLMLSALALGAMTGVAIAGEPVKLTSSQLDAVSAGNPCSYAFASVATCVQTNWSTQTAVAVGGAAFSAFSGNASAANLNETTQTQGDFNYVQ